MEWPVDDFLFLPNGLTIFLQRTPLPFPDGLLTFRPSFSWWTLHLDRTPLPFPDGLLTFMPSFYQFTNGLTIFRELPFLFLKDSSPSAFLFLMNSSPRENSPSFSWWTPHLQGTPLPFPDRFLPFLFLTDSSPLGDSPFFSWRTPLLQRTPIPFPGGLFTFKGLPLLFW